MCAAEALSVVSRGRDDAFEAAAPDDGQRATVSRPLIDQVRRDADKDRHQLAADLRDGQVEGGDAPGRVARHRKARLAGRLVAGR